MDWLDMTTRLDSDRALEEIGKDKFGFAGMAERLAPSIIEASKGDGIVIGLEGRWGAGKTSLLNFLQHYLIPAQKECVYTITISPWLNGDASSLVFSLLEPMREILEKIESDQAQLKGRQAEDAKKQLEEISQLLRDYGPKTARGAASIANLLGHFMPGMQVFSSALEAGASAVEQVIPSESTPSELKQKIIEKIKGLDVSFVVILDDLDRLEPVQAVEVVRLVRSVADFPRVAYLMCYDREVLAQALKTGLQVENGDLYLQKIVQLTFNIPLPEPFDLRIQFLEEAKSIYEKVMCNNAEGEVLEDLKTAVDQQGMQLSTPREVKLALNGVRFIFPQIKNDIYFPDFCRLQLIKTTNYNLYRWLEEYLSVRSVLVTGDATVATDERAKMGERLKDILPSESFESSFSIRSLGRFVPGVCHDEEPEKRVYRESNSSEMADLISLKRLGSPLHYRFYFALSGPKTVMPDNEFNDLLKLSVTDVEMLASRLTEEVLKRRSSGRTWFEHVLDRLDDKLISTLSKEQVVGFLLAFSNMMDSALSLSNTRRSFFFSIDQSVEAVSQSCLVRLKSLCPDSQAETVCKMASHGNAINWLVGYFFRSQFLQHGKLDDNSQYSDQWGISEELLDRSVEILRDRINQEDVKELIPQLPDVSAYLFGWRDMSLNNEAVIWVREYCEDDRGFLSVLNHLRGWAVSDKVYYPLSVASVSIFLDWDETQERLNKLMKSEFSEEVAELKLAISQSRH